MLSLLGFLPLLILRGTIASTIESIRQFRGWADPQFDDVIFDTLDLAEFPVPSLSECLLSCSQDARCVSVFYHKSRSQCRLQGGRFYLAQGGREEQGWRYYLMEMDSQCPAKYGYIHRRDLNLCYRLEFQVQASQPEATSYCAREGGHLLCIDSQEKQDHVVQQIESSNTTSELTPNSDVPYGYYVDGEYINGSWTWPSNGQKMTFGSWYQDEAVPFYKNQIHVILEVRQSWLWMSVSSNHPRVSICEIDI